MADSALLVAIFPFAVNDAAFDLDLVQVPSEVLLIAIILSVNDCDHEGKSFDYEQKSFDHEQKSFDHEQISFDHEQKSFDHNQKSFDHEENSFDHEQK